MLIDRIPTTYFQYYQRPKYFRNR